MRSTLKITGNTSLNNILQDYQRVFNVQNQMSTGRRVNAPSDDPLATNEGLRLDTVISRIEQYNRNIISTKSFLGLSDGVASNMHGLLNDAKALTISSASETTTHEMRQANSVEIQSTLRELITLANAEEAGRYLFGGTETLLPPYEVVGSRYVYYRGNEEDVKAQVDSATFMPINTTGEAVFGSMSSSLSTGDMSPDITFGAGFATRLEDLNNGIGVPEGSINIKYSAYPDVGVNIDLSECDTIEDIAKTIQEKTLQASKELDPKGTAGAPINYLSKRYIKVEINEDRNGISLSETDQIWETTWNQQEKQPSDYPGFTNPSSLIVSEVGGGMVATRLGIDGTVRYNVDPLNVQNTIPRPLVGQDLDPQINKLTLLSDLQGYVDRPFTITNGPLPNKVGIMEINDTNNNYSDWTLNGLDEGINTDKDGELYVRSVETYTGSGEYYLNIYKSDSALETDLVAQGNIPNGGGLIELSEVNNSGVTGSVAMPNVTAILPVPPVTIQAIFDETYSATISVPGFEKELADQTYHDVMDEFRMRGMRRGRDPMDKSEDPTDYDGNFFLEISNTYSTIVSGDENQQLSGLDFTIDQNVVKGLDTDANGKVYIQTTAGGVVNVYNDFAQTNLVATGTSVGPYPETVALTAQPGYNLNGSFVAEQAIVADGMIEGTIADNINVEVYNESISPRSLIATGSLTEGASDGVVELQGTHDFAYLAGSVYVDWGNNIDPNGNGFEYTDPVTGLMQDKMIYNMTATFATTEDLMNAVNMSNTYTSARVSEDGKGIDIVSHLAGAHMIVTESLQRANHYNDFGQLGDINLSSVIKGFNTDYDGKIYSNVTTTKGNDVSFIDQVSGLPVTASTYTNNVSFYNKAPTDADFDIEANAVGQAQLEGFYDSGTGQWYTYDNVTGYYNRISFPDDTKLSINQTNNSGLSGTVVLNSVRFPQTPYEETTYFNPEAAAGEKNLSSAIVIDTSSFLPAESFDAGGNSYDYLESLELVNPIQGYNTDRDGNLHATVGFGITNDDEGQVCKLDLTGVVDGTNTDANGKLYSVTSYAVTGDDAVVDNDQIQQLYLHSFTRGKDSAEDAKIYVEIVPAPGPGSTINFYNDPAMAPTDLVAVGTFDSVAGGTVGIIPEPGYGLKGSVNLPAGTVADANIVIDLEQGRMQFYDDVAMGTGDLVAAGNSDANGDVTIIARGAGTPPITGTARFPTAGGIHNIEYDNDIVVDTRAREVMLYADEDFSKRVGKGDLSQYAGGQVNLLALNSSNLGGTLNFNSVVSDTDQNNQIQDLVLNNILLGNNTSSDGMLYMEVVEPVAGQFEVNIYDGNEAASVLVANGVVDMDTGVVNLTDGGSGSGITGSLQVASPQTWYPTVQTGANNRIHIDVSGQDGDLLISPPLGLKNSGQHREENIFTTLNDVLDAMNNDDVDALHNLIEQFKIDHDRILTARATIGTRMDRAELLELRHDDEIINFNMIRSERIDLDYAAAVVEYQSAQNVFDAALRTSAQLIPMSLVDYV